MIGYSSKQLTGQIMIGTNDAPIPHLEIRLLSGKRTMAAEIFLHEFIQELDFEKYAGWIDAKLGDISESVQTTEARKETAKQNKVRYQNDFYDREIETYDQTLLSLDRERVRYLGLKEVTEKFVAALKEVA